jgi:phytoene desaturase
MPNDPILIIGGGIGGLSAAIHLAARGQRVLVLEQNPQVGGKMSEIRAEGFRFDTGPSVLTMRHVFEELFASAGRRLEDYLNLLPIDPLTRYFYPDGVRLDASRDLPAFLSQIYALEPRDVEGYLAFLHYAARIHRITSRVFIYGPPPGLSSFTKVSPLDYLKADPLRSMYAGISAHVHDPHLRQLLGRFSTYVGASPYLAPATLNVIAHVELAGGVWYPRGGIYTVARAYERLARELGVEIRTGTAVSRITLANGRVTGALANGEHIPTSTVIANPDVTSVYGKLLAHEPDQLHKAQIIGKRERSGSGFILLLGVDGEHPELTHHNIFFSEDYRAEFDDLFSRGQPSRDPTVYVAITSKSDPEHAPRGKENWFVLVNVPANNPNWDWHTQAETYRELVLDKLAGYGYELRPRLAYARALTPLDIENRTGAYRGALYGASANKRLAAFMRPPNRARSPHGLYFAGGTTHPGGGVPMVTLSGKVASEMVLEDLRSTG